MVLRRRNFVIISDVVGRENPFSSPFCFTKGAVGFALFSFLFSILIYRGRCYILSLNQESTLSLYKNVFLRLLPFSLGYLDLFFAPNR